MDWGCYMSKIAIINAVYGGYDTPKKQALQGAEYFHFNEQNYPLNLSPMMGAKYIKTHPFTVGDFDYYIWVDGSYELNDATLLKSMINNLGDADTAFLEHKTIWGRNSILDEAMFCTNIPKYKGQRMMEQVYYYFDKNFPKSHTLYAGGIYITRKNRRTEKFFNHWWNENIIWTYQDQLSLPFCLWKNKVRVKSLDDSIYHKYLRLYGHIK